MSYVLGPSHVIYKHFTFKKKIKPLVNSKVIIKCLFGCRENSQSYILMQTWCPSVRLCGQKLGSAWKILPVTARSLLGQFVLAMGKKIPMDQSGAHSSDTPIRLP
jgi:hypothetical protein